MRRTTIVALALALSSTTPFIGVVHAEAAQKTEKAAANHKEPATPGEHLAAAKRYRQQAASARREAERHRFMIQRRNEVPGQLAPSDWYYQHCQKLIDAATELAGFASDLSDYHEKQAQELRGKAKSGR